MALLPWRGGRACMPQWSWRRCQPELRLLTGVPMLVRRKGKGQTKSSCRHVRMLRWQPHHWNRMERADNPFILNYSYQRNQKALCLSEGWKDILLISLAYKVLLSVGRMGFSVYIFTFLAYFPKMKVGLSNYVSLSVCPPLITFELLGRSSWYSVGKWCQSEGPRWNNF
jgi:hypothetical protein